MSLQQGFDIPTLGRDDRGVVYCRIDGPAPPAPRPRASLVPIGDGKFRAKIVSAYRQHPAHKWKKLARLQILAARNASGYFAPLVEKGQPIEVLILRVRELAKTHHRKTRSIPRSWDTASGSGDVDNALKPVLDAANGILWHDDCQVTRVVAEEIVGAQGEPDRLEIIARPLREIPERTRFEAERDQLGHTGGPHGLASSSTDPDQTDSGRAPEAADVGGAQDHPDGHRPV